MNSNYDNLPAVLNANQLAAALGISRAGAYQLLNTGTFPTLRIGKRLLVPKDKLVEWIEQNTGGSRCGGIKKRLPRFHLLHQMGSSRSRLHAMTVYHFQRKRTSRLTGCL